MFRCKVCAEKDARIEDLKREILFLRTQIYTPNDPHLTPTGQLEADGILSGQQHVLNVPMDADLRADELKYAEEIRSERDRLLSGTYS